MPPKPLLLISLGNPSTLYANTLHSTGHTILNELAKLLQYPPFARLSPAPHGLLTETSDQKRWRESWSFAGKSFKDHAAGKEKFEKVWQDGYTEDWTMWQSPSLMNVSGPGVKKMYDRWRATSEARKDEGILIVVHDELELALGQIQLKRMRGGEFSARGHNGLKSVMGSLPREVKWLRLGVGIGRPVSRESGDVARHVLRKMTGAEYGRMVTAAGDVERLLRKVDDGEVGWV